MRRMGTEDEGRLEEHLVLDSRAAHSGVGAAARRVALRVLVADAEAEELRGREGEIGLRRPLMAGVDGVLRPVVAEARGEAAPPAEAERLQLAEEVPAHAV